MKINLAKSAGFCSGVKRAINIALDAARSGNKVYMLGDIVHNEDVVRIIRGAGIKKIKGLTRPVKNRVLLIRAHGTSAATIEKAAQLGYIVIDATCPMVKDIHKVAKEMQREGRTVIVIGDKDHDEVKGIAGNLKHPPFIIPGEKCFFSRQLRKIKKAGVVVQSTQNIDTVIKITDILRKHIPDLKFINTVCGPTRIKQDEIKQMPLENDAMIIIGSKHSANTKRLYEISKSKNKRSYWINSAGEIKREWFEGTKTTGVTAGASTPASTIQDIIGHINKITKK
jgi:4-hydroxy-3-methylbut-2-en-1-yl diphosphate reductase